MSLRPKDALLVDALDRLEARYGKLVPSNDPVEAGLMTLLAMHAPDLSTAATRDALRAAFVDWNEMRVADPWEISTAVGVPGHHGVRAFGRAALRFLESINAVLHRTSLDSLKADPAVDLLGTVEKMRGAPAPVRAVVLAVLDDAGGWHPGPEMARTLQKLGVVGKTSSVARAGKDAQETARPEDRLRAHYLLTRYGTREKDEEDPLEASANAKRAAGRTRGAKSKSSKEAVSSKE